MKKSIPILTLALLTLAILVLLGQLDGYPVLALLNESPLPPTETDTPPSFCYHLLHGMLVPCESTATPVPTATPSTFTSPLASPKDPDPGTLPPAGVGEDTGEMLVIVPASPPMPLSAVGPPDTYRPGSQAPTPDLSPYSLPWSW